MFFEIDEDYTVYINPISIAYAEISDDNIVIHFLYTTETITLANSADVFDALQEYEAKKIVASLQRG